MTDEKNDKSNDGKKGFSFDLKSIKLSADMVRPPGEIVVNRPVSRLPMFYQTCGLSSFLMLERVEEPGKKELASILEEIGNYRNYPWTATDPEEKRQSVLAWLILKALFWRPQGADRDADETKEAVRAARRAGHRVLVAGEGIEAALMAATTTADGLLLEPTGAQVSLDPGGSFICGALCRTPSAARAAVKAGAHFIVLALAGEPANEQRFVPVLQHLGVPAYLGWYADHSALDRVRASWAHGCAVGPRNRVPG